MVKTTAQTLQAFGTELAETELPNDAEATTGLLHTHTLKKDKMKVRCGFFSVFSTFHLETERALVLKKMTYFPGGPAGGAVSGGTPVGVHQRASTDRP